MSDVVQTHDYEIVRFKRDDYATWGRMADARGQPIVVTLGPPLIVDADGKRMHDRSDFQAGLYRCFYRKSHKHGGDGKRDYDVWQYEGVPDVDAAQLHIGNFPWDSEACTLLGTAAGDVEYDGDTVPDSPYPREHGKSYPGISSSGIAYAKFMKDSLALCASRNGEGRDHIWILVTDSFPAPAGTFA